MSNVRKWESIKSYSDIKFEFFEGIAKITINRPEVYNAFRPETNVQMLEAMEVCRERNDIDIIVITGVGDKAFCSGGDQNVKGVGGYIGEDGVPRGCRFGVDKPPGSEDFIARHPDGTGNRTLEEISEVAGMDILFLSPDQFFDVFGRLGLEQEVFCYHCIGGPDPFDKFKSRIFLCTPKQF